MSEFKVKEAMNIFKESNPIEIKEYAVAQLQCDSKSLGSLRKIANDIQEMYGISISTTTVHRWKKQLSIQSQGGSL